MIKMRKNLKQRRSAARSDRSNERRSHHLDVRVSSKKASSLRWRKNINKFLKLAAALTFVLLLVVSVYRGIDYFLFENPTFEVSDISYSTDGRMSREQVLDCLDLRIGANILRLDLDEMRERILSELPSVQGVKIIRDIPNRLTFKIKERFPVAWLGNTARLQSPQRCRGGLLVSSDGVVMRCDMLEPGYVSLPVIFPENEITIVPGSMIESVALTKGLEIVNSCSNVFKKNPVRLQSLRVTSPYSLVGYLNTGTEVIFGLENIHRQVSNLKVLLDEGTRRGEALATVNLLPKKNIPVRFTELEVSSSPGSVVTPAVPELNASSRKKGGRRVYRSIPRSVKKPGNPSF